MQLSELSVSITTVYVKIDGKIIREKDRLPRYALTSTTRLMIKINVVYVVLNTLSLRDLESRPKLVDRWNLIKS